MADRKIVRCTLCGEKDAKGNCAMIIRPSHKGVIWVHDRCALAAIFYVKEQMRRAKIRLAARAKVK